MSLLEALKNKKSKLKNTETIVTYADGRKFIESGDGSQELKEKSHGFVVDTKPDTIPACILDHNLFLGSQDAVEINNIQKYGITHILSVGIECPQIDCDNLIIKFLPCLDLPETDLKTVCRTSNEFISEALGNSGTVLVHCNAGVSRSTAIVIAFLICCRKFSFEEAYDLVKLKRPCIQPNVDFMRQLKEL